MSDRQIMMFGYTTAQIDEELAGSIKRSGIAMVLTSMLSDAQEMIVSNQHEQARQAINRVKYLINKHVPDSRTA